MTYCVGLVRCKEYSAEHVLLAVEQVFSAIDYAPQVGTHVLVKPNLLRFQEGGLCCTHPAVVQAACIYLKECGVRVTVGDSPAFGSAERVAQGIGLKAALEPLGVPVITLDKPVPTRLPSGMKIGISRYALEADSICNVPRLKAHTQMRLTCAVKNMFGCVSGVRKAIAHSQYGDKGNAFRTLLAEASEALPPTTSLLDGVVGMERTGPSGGDAYSLGVIGAAHNNVALDTAVGMMLGRQPEELPLWAEFRYRGHTGAFRRNLTFPLLSPEDISASDFSLPGELSSESFHPVYLLRSVCLRFWRRFIIR